MWNGRKCNPNREFRFAEDRRSEWNWELRLAERLPYENNTPFSANWVQHVIAS